MDTTNAKMMLGYMDDDDDDEILDYDGNLDLSTDNEDEDEAESIQEYNMQQYPETPDEKIHWQEQIRMIHLRSHLNQLMEKVRHAHYVTDKTREELKKCRSQIQQYETERDQLFTEIQNQESEGNKSAVHRVRAAHQRVCGELEGEQNLEKMIIERLDQAEYELALAEVERGKFLLAEDDLLQREHKLSQEKTDMAMVRLAKEESLARQALTHRRKEDKTLRDVKLNAERRHAQAIEEAERSHERANKYLQKTMDKLKQRETEEAERYKTDMSKKMDMLLKLKNDIAHNRENLQAIRARDKAAERKEREEERQEREQIKMMGGNPEEMLLVKKRKNEVERQKCQYEAEQKLKKAAIMQKILREEENIKKRKQQQPHLWSSAERNMEKRVKPLPLKPVQALEDYMNATADEPDDGDRDNKEKEMLMVQTFGGVQKGMYEINKSVRKKQRRRPFTNREENEAFTESIKVTGTVSQSSSETFKSSKSYVSMLRRLSRHMRMKYEMEQEENKLFYERSSGEENMNQSQDNEELPEISEAIEVEEGAQVDSLEEHTEALLDQSEMEATDEAENAGSSHEEMLDCASPVKDSDGSDEEDDLQATADLARPEFEGLWDKETKPYRIPKDSDHLSAKPVGSSKMDQDILKKVLERTKEGIVITQVAAGREFAGCPFYSKPDVIHFKDFVVGKTYKKKVTLTNVSYTVNYIKFLDITERLKDFIKIHFDPPGQMSAGLTCDMTVTFKPMINEDLKGEVNFLTQTGPFHIPLICSTKKCDLVLDTKCVDFGTTVIGETLKQTFTLTNRGALGTKFDFFKVTGMKQRTVTTAGTSLGRMSDSELDMEKSELQSENTGQRGTLLKETLAIGKRSAEPISDKDDSQRAGFSPATQVPMSHSNRASFAPNSNKASIVPNSNRASIVPFSNKAGFAANSNKGSIASNSNRASIAPNSNRASIEPLPKTTDSMRAVSPDSATDPDPNSKAKTTTGPGSSLAVESKKKSEEALDKIPEAGETSVPPLDEMGESGQSAAEEPDTTLGELAAGEDTVQKQERESDEAMSPDLAVSDMEEYATLDGMRVGNMASGEIGPFSSVKLEIVWQPTLPGRVDPEFLVSFADPLSEPLAIRAIANAIDVPVWVERSTVDLKICMFDRLYQDTILVNNRATTALRLKFEVCKELKNHLELLPKTGYVQAQSQFSAQLKFLPRQSLFQEAAKYFDAETGVLEAPMTIRVADQTTPVHFTVQAVVTTSDLEFDVCGIDFGYCTIHESVKKTVKLTNHSILPQQFGFIGLPEYMEVQPNDGFGTLLPLETLELDVIFSPNKTKEYQLDLVCRSLINRDFKISVRGVGVLTPLELTNQVLHFAATPLYDTASSVLHVVNSHTSSNEFTHPVPRIGKGEICPVGPTSFEFVVPKDSPITVSPSVGTVMPGKTCRIQVRFSPTLNDYEIRQEALRIYTRMEAAREEKEKLEAEEREKKESEEKTKIMLEKLDKLEKPSKKLTKAGKEKQATLRDLSQNCKSDITLLLSKLLHESQLKGSKAVQEKKTMSKDLSQNCESNTSQFLRELLPKTLFIGSNNSAIEGQTSEWPVDVSELLERAKPPKKVFTHLKTKNQKKASLSHSKCSKVVSSRRVHKVLSLVHSISTSRRCSSTKKSKVIKSQSTKKSFRPTITASFKDSNDNESKLERCFEEQGNSVNLNRNANEGEGNADENEFESAKEINPEILSEIISTLLENEAEDLGEKEEDAPAGKGKNKGKASPKGTPQAKTSKLSAAPSSTGSAITNKTSPRFDPDKLSRDSLEYQAALSSLVRQFKGQFQSFTIPCYVASGQTRNPGELKYSIHNTLYLEVHCPAVRPPIVVISDNGRRLIDFGDVSIGQTCPRSVTIQNISEKDMELTATLTNPAGPFLMLNALRMLSPGATHTLLLTFSPSRGQVFQEELGIKTFNSMLHLSLRGQGVNPLVSLSIEDNVFDMSAVLVGEFVEKNFKVQNTSMLAIDYVIKQDSLSPMRHARAQGMPIFLKEDSKTHSLTNYVGTQNDSGKNVFDIVPTKGTIQAGETKEIMVTFAPDHESDLYSDGVRMELFDQEESHFFQLIGQAKPRVMFLDGADPLNPTTESLALQPLPPEEEDADGKGNVVSPPALVTIRSVVKNDNFEAGVREIYAGCVRTMAVSQKKNGEFSLEGIQNLIQKGFTIEPQKGMVEAGTKKPIVFTWTPPSGYDPSMTIEETAILTLRCDVTEQIPLMIRATVVSE